MGMKYDNLISITQAAKLMGVSRPTIYEYIRKTLLKKTTIAGQPYLSKEQCERLTEVLRQTK